MNSKPFKMPYPDDYKALQDALWEYYKKCFPQYDEGERYDLSRDALIAIEDAVSRHYKKDARS